VDTLNLHNLPEIAQETEVRGCRRWYRVADPWPKSPVSFL
jgi:hypothetical protein